MATLYDNLQGGAISDSPLSSGATTINSAAFANLPTVASPDVMYLTLDPEGTAGDPEIVKVTAHTAAATSVTVVRASQSTVARAHLVSTVWVHALTDVDIGEFLKTVATADIEADAVTNAKIADDQIDSEHYVALSIDTEHIAAGQVTLAKMAANSVDSDQYVDGSIDTVHLADDAVTAAKLDFAYPLGVVAYSERTSSINGIPATQTNLTDLSVTFTAVAGRRYKVSHQSIWWGDVDENAVGVNLYNSTTATVLQESLLQKLNVAGSGRDARLGLVWSGTLSAGSVTLLIRAIRSLGSGNVNLTAAATVPAFILVEDIGAA